MGRRCPGLRQNSNLSGLVAETAGNVHSSVALGVWILSYSSFYPNPCICANPTHLFSTTPSYPPSFAVPGIIALAIKCKPLPVGVKTLRSFACLACHTNPHAPCSTQASNPAPGNTVPYVCSFQLFSTRKTLNRGLCGFLLRELNLGSPASV